MNPKVQVAIARTFVAKHSLPGLGVAERHEHVYHLECGHSAEVDGARGCAKSLQEMAAEVDGVVSRIDGEYLNDLLPVPPTAEMLACWILAQLSPEWEWASIRAYDRFMCKVDRAHVLPWLETLRSGHAPTD